MSASVVFAREEAVSLRLCVVVAGAFAGIGCGGGVGAAAAWGAMVGGTGALEAGGADGALGVADGGVPTTGLAELGLFVQASSSNLLTGSVAELVFAGCCTGAEVGGAAGLAVGGELDTLDKALMSTDGGKDLVG